MNPRPTRWIGHRAVQVLLAALLVLGVGNLVVNLVDHAPIIKLVLTLGQIVFFGFLLSQSVQSRRYAQHR